MIGKPFIYAAKRAGSCSRNLNGNQNQIDAWTSLMQIHYTLFHNFLRGIPASVSIKRYTANAAGWNLG